MLRSLTEQLKTKTCSKKTPTQFILLAYVASSYQSVHQVEKLAEELPFIVHISEKHKKEILNINVLLRFSH